MKDPTKLGNKP